MSVTPYLMVPDANAAFALYAKAFGAEEKFRLPAEDGKKVMHGVLGLAGGEIFLSDMGPAERPAGVSVALGLDRADALDALVERAKAAGVTVSFGPQTLPWGRYA